jgi:hypothetical protein
VTSLAKIHAATRDRLIFRSAVGAALALFALVSVLLPSLHAYGETSSASASEEYKVKAAFLYNFARYVRWPSDAFVDDDAPVIVAVFGDDPFGSTLVDALAGKQIGERRFVIERIAAVDKLRPVHLLFVPDTSERDIGAIVEHYAGTSTLIVGDSLKTVEVNGSIGFFIEQKKVRFAINTAAIKRGNLEVSSQLLKLARIVGEKGGRP